MTDLFALDTDVPPWVDPVTVLADVLDVLRLPPTDDDADRVEILIPSAAYLVATTLDQIGGAELPPAPPMHPLVRTAMTNLTVELYRKKDAPFGVLNGWSPDALLVRVSSDVMRGVRSILLPLKKQWGIA